MTLDHLVDHLTEPSTVRGLVWVVGCLVALVLLWKGEHEAGMRALATTGMVAGTIGLTTRDTPPPRDDG